MKLFLGHLIFLLIATDIFSKYMWVIPLKFEKGITITTAFPKKKKKKKLDKTGCKPKKIYISRSM